MVRPVHSKRKLFTSSKEQKENTTPCCTSGKLPCKSGDAEACQNCPATDEGTSRESLRKSPYTAGSSCQLRQGRGDADVASDAAPCTGHCPVNAGGDSPTAKADQSAGTVQSCNAFHCARTASLSTTPHHARTVPFSCSPSGSGVGSSPLSGTPGRYPAMPMSERQQIALLMQMSSPSPQSKGCSSSPSPSSRCHSPYSLHGLHLGQDCTLTSPTMGGRGGGGLAKRNERGETPLHVAAIRGDAAKVQHLIVGGADVNCVDYAGWTALHEACNRGFVSVAHELIRAGASVNAKGLDNETPLHDACVNNHFKIVELLLGSGASTSIVNRRGQTPADVCRSPAILTLLQQASQHSVENNNRTCEIFSKMSRRTPPSNRVENKMQEVKHEPKVEKETKPDESGAVHVTSGQGVVSTTAGTNVLSSSSSNVSGGPSSPRVTLRLPPVSGRTADKTAGTSDAKSSEGAGDDPYEFKCSKDEPGNQATTSTAAEALVEDNTEEDDQEKGEKRPAEEDDDTDQAKKKKRKDDQKEQLVGVSTPTKGNNRTPGDKSSKAAARGNIMNNHPNQLFTPAKSGCNNNMNTSMNSSLSSSSGSPLSGEANNTLASNSSVCSSSGSSNSNGAASSSAGAEVHRKSPLMGSSNSPKAAVKQEKNDEPSDDECCRSDGTSSGTGGPKVPPLKIVLSSCGGGSSSSTTSQEQEQSGQQAGKSAGNRHLPYVVPASQGSETAAPKEDTAVATTDTSNKESSTFLSVKEEPLSPGGSSGGDKGAARITRSHRGTGSCSADEGTTVKAELKPDDGEAKPIRVKTEVKEETAAPSTVSSSSGPTLTSSSIGSEAVHPRKRKINIKEEEPEPAQPPPSEQPLTNCYQMFLKIRRQIDDRRKLLYPVQPKPPQGFKDYLMNRGTYVLAGNPSSQRSVPIMTPPAALSQPLKDLFNEQEDDRYKLRLQHQIEREKLVLSVEQEILRVHGRAARALASQVLPFSACTMLRDQEVYNILTPEQEEKHRNARSRYNGRLFLSWLQDVDDKWEKIKESMVLRQQNEAESLNAVHRMNWECKMKELGLLDNKSRPVIEELHVPMVAVSDFDLLPA